jgi:hypothetical protein
MTIADTTQASDIASAADQAAGPVVASTSSVDPDRPAPVGFWRRTWIWWMLAVLVAVAIGLLLPVVSSFAASPAGGCGGG